MESNEQTSYQCNECQAGHVTRRYITYFTWLGDQLVSVPNFPAWVCDICGRREYDHQAILWLNMLLNPEAGKPARKQVRKAPTIRKQPSRLGDSKP